MNEQQFMIVDLSKTGDKRFITNQVSSINETPNGYWSVQFSSSPHIFNYHKSRLLYLVEAEIIPLDKRGLYINNKRIDNVNKLLCFTCNNHTFFRITYTNGYCEDMDDSKVYITRTPIDKNGGSLWEYLCKLAKETGLNPKAEETEDKEDTEADKNILFSQYELVDIKRDNVPLSQYLGNKTKLNTYHEPKLIYYPFGCNASQKTAVEAALTHQVSFIQGPPGTGKTQTILNIIANLLITGKTILVVSNNNSAVKNVAEKLEGEDLGFVVAQLGSVQNKKEFINNQPPFPDMRSWILDKPDSIIQQVQKSLCTVSQGFEGQLRQAHLKSEYNALLKETTYNNLRETNAPTVDWLDSIPSAQLINLLNLYKIKTSNAKKPGFWIRIQYAFKFGWKCFSFLNGNAVDVIGELERAYYFSRKTELETELSSIADNLQSIDINQSLKTLRSSSLQILKDTLANRYAKRANKRNTFAIKDIKPRTKEFLKEYPVVLSTTYSAKNCISKDMVFDYMIMDEASQVDIKTGALALSCAMNAVIVGDDKQLPNVVGQEEKRALNAILTTYNVDEAYNAATHSFLQSCLEVFKEAPVTLLHEHYRCHPKIIEFCNQCFYNGELVVMTTDKGEDEVLQVVRTPKGNHARERLNQREIDVISQEVMPKIAKRGNFGIITPYCVQARHLNDILGLKDIASTVHKYQGRECDTIIISTVDNAPTKFSDDANLLNVAISRAKSRLCVVTNGNEIPQNSYLAQLIAYIQYNNFEIKESKLHSVFDLLYTQYTTERLAYEASHRKVSEHLSENLVYDLLVQAIAELDLSHTEVLCHYPLSRLISDWSQLDNEEKTFAESPFSHVDFLIYNSLTKQPLHIIEVDGWHYHKNNSVQKKRDTLKDQLLSKFGLCPHRLSTTDIVNVDTIKDILRN
ncbi:MAG: AAA domain-containing protein [Lachnospiraceae bacterium]|nr:AAA domain-containing protein [Lachnospiraceae bacterium]